MGRIAASQVRPDEDGAGNPLPPGVGDAVTTVDAGASSPGLPAVDGAFVSTAKSCAKDKGIPSGSTILGHNHTIADGVQITIEDDGDWLIL